MAVTRFTPSAGALNANDANPFSTFRVVATLNGASNGQLRVTLTTSTSDGTASITAVSIGKLDTDSNMTTTPVALTFGGLSTFTIAQNTSVTSDFVTHSGFTLANGESVVVVIDRATGTGGERYRTGNSNVTSYYKQGAATAGDQIPTAGFSTLTGISYLLESVETNDGSSGQAITGGLFSNSNTFYGATVSQGAAGIAGSLFTNTNTFYTSTVGRGSVGITGGLFSNTPSFLTATVAIPSTAVAYVSSSTLAPGSGRTTSTITAPSSISNGNFLLAIVSAGDGNDTTAPTVTPPAGFTALSGNPFTNNAADPYAVGANIFWKIAASESGSYAFTHVSADSEGFMYNLSGVNATTPFNPTHTTNSFAGGGGALGQTFTWASITPVLNNSMVIAVAQAWDATTTSAPPTGTTPTYTERLDAGSLYVADGVLATAQATGTPTITVPAQSGASPWYTITLSLQPAGTASTQTITGSLFSNTNTFYTSALTRGSVNIGGSPPINTQTFFTSTVVGAYTVAGGLFSNSNSFYTSALTTGSVGITGGLFSNSNTFYTATVGAGAVAVTGSLFSNTNSFYSGLVQNVTGGGQTVGGGLFTATNTFYTSALTAGSVGVSGALFSNTQTFFSGALSNGYVVRFLTLDNVNTFYASTLTTSSSTISGSLFTNTDAFFTSVVAGFSPNVGGVLFENANTFFASFTLAEQPRSNVGPSVSGRIVKVEGERRTVTIQARSG